MHWSRSLKGRAVAVQLLSCPVFLGGGVVAWQQWQRVASSSASSASIAGGASSASFAAGLVAVMLLAEGLGQALLAAATWHGDGRESLEKEFVGEPERSRRWRSSSGKGKPPRTPFARVVLPAVLCSLCFNVVIPSCRLLLWCWGVGAGPAALRGAYLAVAFLLFEWVTWAATWRRPLYPVAMALFVGASLGAGYALYTKAPGAAVGATRCWGLANLLYIGNFLFFPMGARRWMLEISNIPVWVLLAYGSTRLAR
jgi:hypothetical protein